MLGTVGRVLDDSGVLRARHPAPAALPWPRVGSVLDTAAADVAGAFRVLGDAAADGLPPPPAGVAAACAARLAATPPVADFATHPEAALRVLDGWGWLHVLVADLARVERALVPRLPANGGGRTPDDANERVVAGDRTRTRSEGTDEDRDGGQAANRAETVRAAHGVRRARREVGNAVTPPAGEALVLFGITGDLAKKMVLPALYRLTQRNGLPVPVVGVALTDWDVDALRAHVAASVRAAVPDVETAALDDLLRRVHLVAGDYADPATFDRLTAVVDELAGRRAFLVHYLAVPPALFTVVADGLAAAGLNERARIVVEKPFGHDLASARTLNERIRRHFPEDRLFRVDHYLGKEPVEDLLVLRFANTLLESLWNGQWVRRMEITMAEDFDVADRGSFYDSVGTVRDVLQNHLLQVLAYLTMDAPVTDTAEAQQDAKHRLLQYVRPIDPAETVRGRYAGYLETPGVARDSTTETFVAVTVHIDDWRWAEVPIRIRAGKCLPSRTLEVVAELRRPPRRLFTGPGGAEPAPNLVRLRLQPDAGLGIDVLAKQHGSGDVAVGLPLAVDFRSVLGAADAPYVRIFADALAGDPAHFARMDMLEEAWRIVGPVLDAGTAPLEYERDVGRLLPGALRQSGLR